MTNRLWLGPTESGTSPPAEVEVEVVANAVSTGVARTGLRLKEDLDARRNWRSSTTVSTTRSPWPANIPCRGLQITRLPVIGVSCLHSVKVDWTLPLEVILACGVVKVGAVAGPSCWSG